MIEHKVACHADGERCLGCKHYYGLSDKCEYAGKTNLENKMKIDDLTVGEAKQLVALFGGQPSGVYQNDHPYEIGAIYLIRTVTMIDTGRLLRVTPMELVLEDAAWIADTGRFSDALKSLSFNEVEPFPEGEIIIGRGAIIDAVKIKEVQRSQK